MKKILLSIAVLFCISYAATAQVNSNAIGLRLGYGVEVSYQHALSESNRLEFDLGLTSLNFDPLILNVSGLYQTVYGITSDVPGLNWYWGVGAGLGVWGKSFGIGVLGDIGIEYTLPKAPVQFSLDWRPGLYFVIRDTKPINFGWEGICLGVRYKF